MSGISRMIAKELSSALGIIDNPKYNPMFKQTEEALTDVADPNDPTVARFYSPLESAIDEAPIGKEGTRGENIEAYVRKRAPKVTAAEMEYRGLGLEPDAKYTREVLSGVRQREDADQILNDFETINNYSYIEISDSLDDWIYNNNPKALDKMMSIGRMYDDYRQEVQDHLSYLFDGKKIPVQRIEGYADPFAKKKKTITTIDVDDVIAIGNPTEREVITKEPDTGRYISYSVLTGDILKPLEVKAVKKGSRYRNMQRQSSLLDKELDYTELGLDASEDLGYTTHFGPSNLAHARYSLRDGDKGNYILIEELQSDPLQNVVEDLPAFKKKEKAALDTSLEYNYEDLEWLINTKGSGFVDKAINKIKSYIEDVVIPTQLNSNLTKEERKNIFKKAVKDIDVPEDLIFGDSGSISNVTFNILSKEFDDIPDEELGRITDSMHNRVSTYIANLGAVTNKKDLPVQSISDSIRMSLQAIIADAKAKGVNEIVLPPVEKLAEKRFADNEIPKKIAKGSAFHNTYVAGYNKVLKQLKAELGDQIKIGKKDLIYRTTFKDAVDKTQGVLLDISNLTIDPANIKLRFNKGGLVERRTK
jgi:hypothetical protein